MKVIYIILRLKVDMLQGLQTVVLNLHVKKKAILHPKFNSKIREL